MDTISLDASVRKAQKIVLDIWQTWYGGAPEWTPANNIPDLLSQIGNSLLGLPEFAAANNARLTAQNAIASIGGEP